MEKEIPEDDGKRLSESEERPSSTLGSVLVAGLKKNLVTKEHEVHETALFRKGASPVFCKIYFMKKI